MEWRTHPVSVLLFLVCTGCLSDLGEPISKQFVDRPDEDWDGDGQSEQAGDCNDADDAVYTGNLEMCDGVDNNCNDEIDEATVSAPLWHKDQDNDGYVVFADNQHSCIQPIGYIEQDLRSPKIAMTRIPLFFQEMQSLKILRLV